MPLAPAYIIAARRTALGRVGGLHRSRRIEELTSPVVIAALTDCGVAPDRVEEIVIGNATQGGNPVSHYRIGGGIVRASLGYDDRPARGLWPRCRFLPLAARLAPARRT